MLADLRTSNIIVRTDDPLFRSDPTISENENTTNTPPTTTAEEQAHRRTVTLERQHMEVGDDDGDVDDDCMVRRFRNDAQTGRI